MREDRLAGTPVEDMEGTSTDQACCKSEHSSRRTSAFRDLHSAILRHYKMSSLRQLSLPNLYCEATLDGEVDRYLSWRLL